MDSFRINYEYIASLIDSFNQDFSLNKLKSRYQNKSIFEITKTARTEKVHSAFLAWLFKENFNNIPLIGLLKILKLGHKRQLEKSINKNAEKLTYHSEIFKKHRDFLDNLPDNFDGISIINVHTEYPIPSISGKRKHKSPQYIDLLLECKLSNGEVFYIVIENKVFADETKIQIAKKNEAEIIKIGGENCIIEKNNKKLCGQTLAYFRHFRNERMDKYVIFAFLDPSSAIEIMDAESLPMSECKGYVHITYQDIMNEIIYPLSKLKDIDDHSRYMISEYLKCLGTTLYESDEVNCINQDKIQRAMAVDTETRELIKEFWEKHNTLIMATLDTLAQDPNIEEEDRDNIKSAISAIRSSRNHNKYVFSYEGVTFDNEGKGFVKRNLLKEIISKISFAPDYLINSFKDIKDYHGKCGVIGPSTFLDLKNSYSNKFDPWPVNNPEVYISLEWGIDNMKKMIDWAASEGIFITEL